MYESQTKFVSLPPRDVALLEQGALKYACPILQVDTQDIHETIKQITQYYNAFNGYYGSGGC